MDEATVVVGRMDPWRFQVWAFKQQTGNPSRKAVFSMLAMMADSATGRCEAKQETLAAGTEMSVRSVGGHLKALERDGFIARRPQFRRDGRRRGDEFLLLLDADEWPDGDPVSPPADSAGGRSDTSQPVARHDTQPVAEQERPLNNDRSKDGTHARDPKLSPPTDFPDELRPHARVVLPLLERIAEHHGAKRVWPLSLGKTLMRFRHKPLVATAHDLDRWAVDPPRVIKDVVGTYASFLEKTSDLQGVERLGTDDLPAAPSRAGRPASGVSELDRKRLESMQKLMGGAA